MDHSLPLLGSKEYLRHCGVLIVSYPLLGCVGIADVLLRGGRTKSGC